MDERTFQEKFREFLETKGERLTRERVQVVQQISAQRRSFSVEELITCLGASNQEVRVSRATVYRAIRLLEEAGLILKSPRHGGGDFFEVSCG